MAAGHPRVNCCVPGCGRGTTRITPHPEGTSDLETGDVLEWICAGHWPRVPKTLKRRRRALFRLWDRLGKRYGTTCWWTLPPGSGPRIHLVRLERLIRAVWTRCKGHAGSELVAPDTSIEDELRRLGL